ncbi:MAG: LysR family transcriptional regulator [Burkholderiales bacterium]|nr:LysR family transcriptional regulator [Burkholderiales bacterium]
MEPRDLEYFAVIAEHGNLRRAADTLGMSQPALSKSLRRSERWAGAKLVERTPKGIRLTDLGTALSAGAKRLRLSFDDLQREIHDLSSGRTGCLRVGTDVYSAEHVLPQVSIAFIRHAPKVTLKITAGAGDVLVTALRRGELDLIVGGIPQREDEDLVQEGLYEDDFIVYASARHPLAHRKRLGIADLASQQWAISSADSNAWRWFEAALREAGLPAPAIGLETSSISLRLQAVSASHLLGFTGSRVLHGLPAHISLVDLRVKGTAWRRTCGIRHRRGAYLSAAAHRFIDELKKTTRKLYR